MAELPRRLVDSLKEIERAGRTPMPMDRLTALAVDVVGTALRADSIALLHTDPATFLAVEAVVNGLDARSAAVFFERIYLQRERVSFLDLRARGAAVSLLSEYTRGKLEEEPRYTEVYRPNGIRHEARVCLRTGDAYWGGLCIGRASDAPDFDRSELGFLRRLATRLGETLRQARRLETTATFPDGSQPEVRETALCPATFLVDSQRRVVAASLGGERVLDDIQAHPIGNVVGTPLPMPIQSAVAALEVRRASGEAVEAPPPDLTLRGRSGRWWTVCALSPAMAGSLEVAAMVVVCPARPRQKFTRMAAMYGLTGQERRVVDLIARGFSTDEIAGRLNVAACTVQDHLKSVFHKTDVRSRQALLAHLFHTESP